MHEGAKGNASFQCNQVLARVLGVSSPYCNSCMRFSIPLDGITPVCVQLMEYLAAIVILYKQSSGIITLSEHPVWRSAGPSVSGLVNCLALPDKQAYSEKRPTWNKLFTQMQDSPQLTRHVGIICHINFSALL